MYFISSTNQNDKTLTPRVPSNFFTKNGYEDNKTPRISFAPDIDKCLMGIPQKCSNMEFFVHEPVGHVRTKNPTIKEVPDSDITKEIWALEPVTLKCIGKIKVIGDANEEGISFNYGKQTAELYKWNWKWIQKGNVVAETYSDDMDVIREGLYDKETMVRPIVRKETSTMTEKVYVILTTEKNWISKTISLITDSTYAHATISFDDTFNNVYGFGRNIDVSRWDSKFIKEDMRGGFYKQNKNIGYLQLAFKVTPVELSRIKSVVNSFISNQDAYKYDKLGLLLSGVNISHEKQDRFVCSGFVAYVFMKAGINLFNKSYSLARPNDYANHSNFHIHDSGLVHEKIKRDDNELDMVVNESALSTKQRNRLRDSSFGIPEERKYPLTDKAHVLQAIRFFDKCEKKYEVGLAKRIIKRMRDLKMAVDISPNNNLYKYINKPITEGVSKMFGNKKENKECNKPSNENIYNIVLGIFRSVLNSPKYKSLNECILKANQANELKEFMSGEEDEVTLFDFDIRRISKAKNDPRTWADSKEAKDMDKLITDMINDINKQIRLKDVSVTMGNGDWDTDYFILEIDD